MPRTKKIIGQREIEFPESPNNGTKNLGETFKGLYYRLYSNSATSRAEKLFENLAIILLLKFGIDKSGDKKSLQSFLDGKITASVLLRKQLRQFLPKNADFSFSIGDDSIRDALSQLSRIDLASASAHVLGEAFQSLIGPRLRGDKGQFFTPRSLVKAMVRILGPEPHESVLDPACGTGGFLSEAHIYQQQRALGAQPTGMLKGIEKDADLARLAMALLHIGTDGRTDLVNANSLDASDPSSKGMSQEVLFDVVLTNPPFGSRIPIDDKALLSRYELGKDWVCNANGQWSISSVVLEAQDPQILFIERCVSALRPGGRMGIVLPEGVFGNRQQGYVWEWLRQHGRITALLDCPRTTFQPSTDTKTNVLFFEKAHSPITKIKEQSPEVMVAVAIHCGHDRRGRTHRPDGTEHPDDFQELAADFVKRKKDGGKWRKVNLTKPDYLVPRYYLRDSVFTEAESQLIKGARLATIEQLIKEGTIAVRKGHEVGSHAYGSGEIPFVRTSDVNNFEISTDPTNAVSEDFYEEYKDQQNLKAGDILMVVDGRYRIGACAILSENNFRCVVQSHFRIINILRPDKFGPYELLYALALPSVRIRIRDLVFVQSTLGTLGRRLLELEIPILHGQGPWRDRILEFEDALKQRDTLLAKLRGMAAQEVEL